MRNGNDRNFYQLSLNEKKEKLEEKIGYWKACFDLLRKQECDPRYLEYAKEEIQEEIKEMEKSNPSLISKRDFFMFGVEEAQQLLGGERSVQFEMVENVPPVLKDYERLYYYVQGLDDVYSSLFKKHADDAPAVYAQEVVQEIGTGGQSRREDELKRESFYKMKIHELQNELKEKETQLRKLKDERDMKKEKLIEALKEKETQLRKLEELKEEKNMKKEKLIEALKEKETQLRKLKEEKDIENKEFAEKLEKTLHEKNKIDTRLSILQKDFNDLEEENKKLQQLNRKFEEEKKKLLTEIEKYSDIHEELERRKSECQELKKEFSQIKEYFGSKIDDIVQKTAHRIQGTDSTRNPLIPLYWLEFIQFLKKKEIEEAVGRKVVAILQWLMHLQTLTETIVSMFDDSDCLFSMKALRDYSGQLPAPEEYHQIWQQAHNMPWDEAAPQVDSVLSFKENQDYRLIGFPRRLAEALEEVATPLPVNEDEKQVMRKFLTVCALAFEDMWRRYQDAIDVMRRASLSR